MSEASLGPRVDVTAAAAYLGRSRSWLDKERAAGRGPRFLKVGGRIAYRIADLDEYLDDRIRETSDTRRAA
jgi:predicted DNA-binding transcriptional regulator AlpA